MQLFDYLAHFANFAFRCIGLWWSLSGLSVLGVLVAVLVAIFAIKGKIDARYHAGKVRWATYRSEAGWAVKTLVAEHPIPISLVVGLLLFCPVIVFAVWKEHEYWLTVHKRRLGTIGALRATIETQKKRIAELEAIREVTGINPKAGWISDLAFRAYWQETAGYNGSTRPGCSIGIDAMGVIPPPHVIRLEFDKDIAVDDVIADKESAFDFRWKQVAPRVIEVRFSGPAMSPARSVVAAIFAKGNPEFQVKAVRRFTVASGARGISSDQHPKE